MHGYRVGKVIYWNKRDAHFGQRGIIAGSSKFYEEPCVVARFGAMLYHTICADISCCDPKYNRKNSKLCAQDTGKRLKKTTARKRRPARHRREHRGLASLASLNCSLCGDVIHGVPCCASDEVCELFLEPYHLGCLLGRKAFQPWTRYKPRQFSQLQDTPTLDKQETKDTTPCPKRRHPLPPRNRKPPISFLDAWCPKAQCLGSAARKKCQPGGLPSARAWRCVGKQRRTRAAPGKRYVEVDMDPHAHTLSAEDSVPNSMLPRLFFDAEKGPYLYDLCRHSGMVTGISRSGNLHGTLKLSV